MYPGRLGICLDVEEKELTVTTGETPFQSRRQNSAPIQLELLRFIVVFGLFVLYGVVFVCLVVF